MSDIESGRLYNNMHEITEVTNDITHRPPTDPQYTGKEIHRKRGGDG